MRGKVWWAIGIIAAIALSVYIARHVSTESYKAVVLERVYSPSSSSFGTAYIPSSGKSGGHIGFVNTYTSEKYTVIVRDVEGGEAHSEEISAGEYVGCKVGDTITLDRLVWK